MDDPGAAVRVLHVDDEPAFTDLTAEMLEREDERFDVETADSADEGLQRLQEMAVDCIVSDYDMPGRNGLEFLAAVREDYPQLPFVLFTGKGSESVASDAISAGVSDYLQKGSGTERYTLLANRIETAVTRYRAERELERQVDLFAKAQDIASVGAWEYDCTTGEGYSTDEVMRIYGLDVDRDLSVDRSLDYYHPEDRSKIRDAFEGALEAGGPYDRETRFIDDDGNHRWVRTSGEPQFEGGDVVRVRGILQDITERKRRERRLERKNERLEEFAHVVSHDIRTPLQVASGQLEVARETGNDTAFEKVRDAHEWMEAIIDEVLTLARQGEEISDTEQVSLAHVARDAWTMVDTPDAALTIRADFGVEADPDRLCQLFENLFSNAVEHADGTVTVGPVESFPTTTRGAHSGPRGFYVADDGPGIPEDKCDIVFEAGYSTSQDGTGFGLSIVEQVAEAHDWDTSVTDSVDGGARFEFLNVDTVPE
ncbi:hybrid sensor histidine kinase/response regulator [Halobacteriales archaeon QH_10_67_22]|nr:MAG: hybrid sensor histidine kinase/response regulator [Halobacteriales archaeon QH_10_67_22]